MSDRQNVVEINGHRYDALTGKLLTGQTKPSNKVIDGFVRHSASGHTTSKHTAAKPRQHHRSDEVHSKTAKSSTLMRSAVHKPGNKPVHHTAKKTVVIHDEARLRRAQAIPKSHLVSKFGSKSFTIKTKLEPVAVKTEPQSTQVEPASLPILPQHNLSLSPFENALHKAVSHKQPKTKKTPSHHKVAKKLRMHPSTLRASSAVAVLLLIGGVIAYRNVPGLSVQLASSRAGINASLPGYHPTGFSLSGPVEYSRGKVAVSFKSNSDDRIFKVVQQKSDWTNQSLENNLVRGKEYEKIADNGRTIYVYEGKASWVNGGTWYQIEGNTVLNTEQLVKIASSL